MKKKVLVIAAHPDDEVLGMGGTIARLSSEGYKISLLIITDGSSTQYLNDENIDSIIEEKKRETKEAADILGIDTIYYGGLPDMKLDTIPHIRINEVIENIIYKIKPNIVFTHFWGDVNIDHQAVYKSTLVVARPLINQCINEIYCYSVPSSTEWNPAKAHTAFMPNTFVGIEEYAENKYNAMLAYKKEIRDYPHPRSIKYLEIDDLCNGQQVGMKHVECFYQLRRLIK